MARGRLNGYQLCRLAICARVACTLRRAVAIVDVADALELEITQAGRFLRQMQRLGYLERREAPRGAVQSRAAYYGVTQRWSRLIRLLRLAGREPGRCCVCGSTDTVPYPFCEHFFCRDCLMEADRDDYR